MTQLHMARLFGLVTLAVSLTSCSTPFHPPVFVGPAIEFPGLAHLVKAGQPLHVIMVHGMCTHRDRDAFRAMNEVDAAIERNVQIESFSRPAFAAPVPQVRVLPRNDSFSFGVVRFHALMWSDMTTPLKEQLDYDKTGVPSECGGPEIPNQCKPKRALYNGRFKDGLLDDCLADAIAYQGESRNTIRSAMVVALTEVMQEAAADEGRVAIITASLGSKIAFDALVSMLDQTNPTAQKAAAQALAERLDAVYMEANQLPILGLADQDIGAISSRSDTKPDTVAPGSKADPLRQFLARRQTITAGPVKIVAFTDPNDLLSYRLLGSRYASIPNVALADVLVSNDDTYLGLVENPQSAHLHYGQNPDVAFLIACGRPKSNRCR